MVIGECSVSVWCDVNMRGDEAWSSREPNHPYVAFQREGVEVERYIPSPCREELLIRPDRSVPSDTSQPASLSFLTAHAFARKPLKSIAMTITLSQRLTEGGYKGSWSP